MPTILSDKTKSLISEYTKENELPAIGFKENSSMHDIAQSFFSILVGNDASLDTALESFDGLSDLSFGQASLLELDQIADKMATKINCALADIRSVCQETEITLQASGDLFRKLAASDPVMNKFLKLEAEKIEFPTMEWQKLHDYSAESSLVLSVNSQAHNFRPDCIDMTGIQFHINQLPFVNRAVEANYATIKASKDFTEFLKSVKSPKAVDFEEIFLNERRGKQFLSEIIHFISPVHGTVLDAPLDTTCKMLDYLQAYGLIRDTLREDLSGFGGAEYDSLQRNMGYIQSYLDILAYAIIGQRRTVYQDAYILPNGFINPDNTDAFVASGMSTVQLNNSSKYYMSILHRFPSGGLSIAQIQREAEMVDKYIEDQFTSAKFDANIQTKQFQARALQTLLLEKIRDARSKQIRGFNESQLNAVLQNEMDLFVTGAKTDYDAINDFLMSLYHPFKMSEKLYKAFKEAYKTLPNAGTITNTDLKMIETKVITKSITEFCKKAFC